MISSNNKSVNSSNHNVDFTVKNYRKILKLAKDNYDIESYSNIPWGKRFVLWRHDFDFSINRGLALAKIENEESVKATYFVNPHSEFYNIAETNQHKIMQEILSLGHDLGLHFDAAFYGKMKEGSLDYIISQEASYLFSLFKVKPVAFSFHNPVDDNLSCDADSYGGLVNCYSKRLREEVSYCSDSNGYWRFHRLNDVLQKGEDPCLQVLTHPGWWQEEPAMPRQRIFQSVYGRAAATMRYSDKSLELHDRINYSGSEALLMLKNSQEKRYALCDYLWNQSEFESLFIELWRLLESQINRLCKVVLYEEWHIPKDEINEFFNEYSSNLDGWDLFASVFEVSLTNLGSIKQRDHQRLVKTRNQIIRDSFLEPTPKLEEDCLLLCSLMNRLSKWGKAQPIAYDGLIDRKLTPKSKKKVNSNEDLEEKFNEGVDSTMNSKHRNWEKLKSLCNDT